MAVVNPESLFPFDEYRRRLQELENAAEAFAQATVNSVNRVSTSYEQSLRTATQLRNALAQVNVTQTDAAQRLAAYASQVDSTTDEVEGQRRSIVALNEVQRINAQLVEQSRQRLDQLEAAYRQLDPAAQGYNAQQKAIHAETRLLLRSMESQTRLFRQGASAAGAAEGSYQKLAQQTAELRKQLKQEADAFDLATGEINKHNVKAKEMLAVIERNEKALKRADAAMGNHTRNVGNYGSSLSGVTSNALAVAGAVLGVASAMDAAQKAVQIISDYERLDASLKAVSKDTDDFARSQQFLLGLADQLGLRYDTLVGTYKGLKAATKDTALEGKATEQIFSSVVKAGAALKISNEGVEGTLRALTQIMSKGKVQAEELRSQLGEHLPGAVKLLAQAMGVSEIKLNKMMEQGELLATDVLPKLATQLDKTYGQNAQDNVNTMAGGWNRLTNEVHLFLAALNNDGAITRTTNGLLNLISEVTRGMRLAIASNDWQTFWGAFAPGVVGQQAKQKMADYSVNDRTLTDFRGMNPGQRQAMLSMTEERVNRNEQRLNNELGNSIAGPQKTAVENNLKRDRDLLVLLRRENLKLLVRDRKDADQAEINAMRKAQQDKELEEERARKLAKEREAARRKAETEADRRLRGNLSNVQADTGTQLAQLTDDRQAGLVSEQDFIEKRLAITLDGIRRRQNLLRAAGKEETDDYKEVQAEKIKADTQYSRDQQALDLRTLRQRTETELSGLAEKKAEGVLSERAYAEERHRVTLAGLEAERQLIVDNGQQETELFKDVNSRILAENAKYYRERLKAEEKTWQEQLSAVKDGLSAIDTEVSSELEDRLNTIADVYERHQQAIEAAVRSGQMSPAQGQQRAHELRLEQLEQEINAVEFAYSRDRQLSNALFDEKIKNLEAYKENALRTPAEIAAADEALAKLRRAKEKEDAEDKKKLDKEVADNAKKVRKENHDDEMAKIEQAKEKRQALFELTFRLASTIGDAVSSITAANLDAENSRLEKQKQNELRLAGDNADARARIEEDFAKKSAEIKRKQAIADRNAALFNIALSTAQAVASVLSTGGGTRYADFGISAGVLSAFVIAQGAIQAAAVLARPLPEFWKGTSNAPEGPAKLAERGPELRQKTDGSYQLYETPTVDYLDRGDRIFTADQTRRMLDEWKRRDTLERLAKESALMGGSVSALHEGRITEQVLIQQSGPQGLTKREVRDAFLEALSDRPIQETYFDADGVQEFVRRGRNRTEYLNRRNRFQ